MSAQNSSFEGTKTVILPRLEQRCLYTIDLCTRLICCLSHELLGWLSPNGRDRYNPSDVIIDYSR